MLQSCPRSLEAPCDIAPFLEASKACVPCLVLSFPSLFKNFLLGQLRRLLSQVPILMIWHPPVATGGGAWAGGEFQHTILLLCPQACQRPPVTV
jgi:hypothetical protein